MTVVLRAELTEQTIELAEHEAARRASGRGCGGGIRRRCPRSRRRAHGDAAGVLRAPPAQQTLAEVAAEIAADSHGVRAIAVSHRIGTLRIGDAALVAAVAADHRRRRSTPARRLVDTVKARLPVWKHQFFADGSDEWVGLGLSAGRPGDAPEFGAGPDPPGAAEPPAGAEPGPGRTFSWAGVVMVRWVQPHDQRVLAADVMVLDRLPQVLEVRTLGLCAPSTRRIHGGARRAVRPGWPGAEPPRAGRNLTGHRLVGRVECRVGDVDGVERRQRVGAGGSAAGGGRRAARRCGRREPADRQYGVQRRTGVQCPHLRAVDRCRRAMSQSGMAAANSRPRSARPAEARRGAVAGRARHRRRVPQERAVAHRAAGWRIRQRRVERDSLRSLGEEAVRAPRGRRCLRQRADVAGRASGSGAAIASNGARASAAVRRSAGSTAGLRGAERPSRRTVPAAAAERTDRPAEAAAAIAVQAGDPGAAARRRCAESRRTGPAADRPGALALGGQHALGDGDLLVLGGQVRGGGVLAAAVRRPGARGELQAAVIAVAGVDGPVAAGLAAVRPGPIRRRWRRLRARRGRGLRYR